MPPPDIGGVSASVLHATRRWITPSTCCACLSSVTREQRTLSAEPTTWFSRGWVSTQSYTTPLLFDPASSHMRTHVWLKDQVFDKSASDHPHIHVHLLFCQQLLLCCCCCVVVCCCGVVILCCCCGVVCFLLLWCCWCVCCCVSCVRVRGCVSGCCCVVVCCVWASLDPFFSFFDVFLCVFFFLILFFFEFFLCNNMVQAVDYISSRPKFISLEFCFQLQMQILTFPELIPQ